MAIRSAGVVNVYIYGIIGQAGALQMPLDDLDVDDLDVGREFMHGGKIYEIRSIYHVGQDIRMNVVMATEPP